MHSESTMMRFFLSLLLLFTLLGGQVSADTYVGPLINFDIYHRRAPEETSSFRLSGGLGLSTEFVERWPGLEVALMYGAGVDTFATQNSADEKIFRARLGTVYRPLALRNPLVGMRLGAQFSLIRGLYSRPANLSSQNERAGYWSPYLGLEGLVIPAAGFCIQEQLTLFYDQYFKAWIFEMSFGVIPH